MLSAIHERYGVRFQLSASPELLTQAECALPLEARGLPRGSALPSPDVRLYEVTECDAGFRLAIDGVSSLADASLADTLSRIEGDAKFWVSATALEYTFVHAGAVEISGAAVLFPGESRSGKTTLVAELLKCGAGYLSDDFAVVDKKGMVWPFPRPLSVRIAGGRTAVDPGELGSDVAQGPLPICGIVATTHQAGSSFAPVSVSKGEMLLELVQHSPAMRLKPQQTLQNLGLAVANATGVKGVRGEASSIAQEIMRLYTVV